MEHWTTMTPSGRSCLFYMALPTGQWRQRWAWTQRAVREERPNSRILVFHPKGACRVCGDHDMPMAQGFPRHPTQEICEEFTFRAGLGTLRQGWTRLVGAFPKLVARFVEESSGGGYVGVRWESASAAPLVTRPPRRCGSLAPRSCSWTSSRSGVPWTGWPDRSGMRTDGIGQRHADGRARP